MTDDLFLTKLMFYTEYNIYLYIIFFSNWQSESSRKPVFFVLHIFLIFTFEKCVSSIVSKTSQNDQVHFEFLEI